MKPVVRTLDGSEVYITFKKVRKLPVEVKAAQVSVPFEVQTLEGTMRGNAGDYLIEGVNGEMYPCAADIFEKTYEEV